MTRQAIVDGACTLLRALEQREIRHKLWIVQGSKIREYWADES